MRGLRNYTNTRKELQLAEKRLDILRNRKEELYNRLVMPKGWQMSDGGGVSTKEPESNTEKYVLACNTPSEATGMSLNEEIAHVEQEIYYLRKVCEMMEETLEQLTGIEATLYSLIIIGGKAPTDAVREVADMQYMTEDNIWHTYYRKIKPFLDLLE